jgi:uncharacterized membrane protein (UPF0127 family)
VVAVEIAETDAERAKGLMFRKELPEGQGMLFDFHREQDVAMWMQNTYISLDMLFIRGDGRILSIAENTEPLSTRVISSGGPVRGVLEVIAGTARKLGRAIGWPIPFLRPAERCPPDFLAGADRSVYHPLNCPSSERSAVW